jgi:hypothetical protein
MEAANVAVMSAAAQRKSNPKHFNDGLPSSTPAEEGCAGRRSRGVKCLMQRRTKHKPRLAVSLSRQRSDFRCLHFVVERGPVSAMFHFEYSLNLQVVTIA